MKYATRPISGTTHAGKPAQAAFTLAEVLAALVFMAIVIPVAIQGLRVASLAGEVGQRKSQAARIAERVLNESIVTTNWNQSFQKGTVIEAGRRFEWTLRNDPWSANSLRQISVEVQFLAQARNYSVRLTTVADSTTPGSTSASATGSATSSP